MPITILVDREASYSFSKFEGKVSDEEMLKAYATFYESEDWSPELNELIDLSDADLSVITNEGVRKLVQLSESVFSKYDLTSVKTAIYAPGDLGFGLSRMYSLIAECQSPELVHVFKKLSEAKQFLNCVTIHKR